MKRNLFALIMLSVALCAFLMGCEQSTQIIASSISEITSAGSKNYGVRISYSDDKRLNGKGCDTQIKFNKTGTITIWLEGQEKIEYEIEDIDEWFSLTTIFAKATKQSEEVENEKTNVKFEKFEDSLSKTYLFNFDGSINITFRVVVGEITDSSDDTGEILVETEPISNQFTLKMQ
jgi:hypothetical protein